MSQPECMLYTSPDNAISIGRPYELNKTPSGFELVYPADEQGIEDAKATVRALNRLGTHTIYSIQAQSNAFYYHDTTAPHTHPKPFEAIWPQTDSLRIVIGGNALTAQLDSEMDENV